MWPSMQEPGSHLQCHVITEWTEPINISFDLPKTSLTLTILILIMPSFTWCILLTVMAVIVQLGWNHQKCPLSFHQNTWKDLKRHYTVPIHLLLSIVKKSPDTCCRWWITSPCAKFSTLWIQVCLFTASLTTSLTHKHSSCCQMEYWGQPSSMQLVFFSQYCLHIYSSVAADKGVLCQTRESPSYF